MPLKGEILIRLDTARTEAIDELAARLPGATRTGIARSLLEDALDALERDPHRLVRPAANA